MLIASSPYVTIFQKNAGETMKSIKQGRGNSFISGFICIFVALFGLFWTFAVIGSGGGVFGLFGLIFVAIGILNAVRSFRNAFAKNRESEYDIVDETEESDPWNERFGPVISHSNENVYNAGNSYCPYCGNSVQRDFEFCNNCGKRLPD